MQLGSGSRDCNPGLWAQIPEQLCQRLGKQPKLGAVKKAEWVNEEGGGGEERGNT